MRRQLLPPGQPGNETDTEAQQMSPLKARRYASVWGKQGQTAAKGGEPRYSIDRTEKQKLEHITLSE